MPFKEEYILLFKIWYVVDNPSQSLYNSQRRREELIVSRLIQLCCHKELISSIHSKTVQLLALVWQMNLHNT